MTNVNTQDSIKLYKQITKIIGNTADYRNKYATCATYKWYAKGKSKKVAKKLKFYIDIGVVKINKDCINGCKSIILRVEQDFYISKK